MKNNHSYSTRFFVFSLILICFSVSSQEVAPNSSYNNPEIDLYILAGQSNAQGYASKGADYPYDTEVDAKIKFNWTLIKTKYKSEGWTTMEKQMGRFKEGYFGSEVTFARALKADGDNVAIFKYTKPGSNLYKEWARPGEGGYFDSMVADFYIAKKQLISQGYKVNLKGFIWIQGESDIKNIDYKSDLQTLIDYVRNNLANNPEMYMILGVDEQYPGMMKSHVLADHKDIAKHDENIIFSSMLKLPKADKTHLTASGAIVQGKRIYDGLKCLETKSNSCFENERAYNISSVGNTISYKRSNWGQSFVPEYCGLLRELRFNAASKIDSSFTLIIKKGNDCNGTVISTQIISTLKDGENIITLKKPIPVNKKQSYFFNIKSDSDTAWKIKYSTKNNVNGNLKTYRNADANKCDYNFLNYDWDFNVFIEIN